MDAKFWTDGCGTSIACGSIATELIKGKRIAEALKIDSEFILNTLEGLPESDVHCAVLASDTLRAAIRNYLTSNSSKGKIEQWKHSHS
jgi:nitrogen fixation NifU-like protein